MLSIYPQSKYLLAKAFETIGNIYYNWQHPLNNNPNNTELLVNFNFLRNRSNFSHRTYGEPEEIETIWQRLSKLTYMKNQQTPFMIFHGYSRCPDSYMTNLLLRFQTFRYFS